MILYHTVAPGRVHKVSMSGFDQLLPQMTCGFAGLYLYTYKPEGKTR